MNDCTQIILKQETTHGHSLSFINRRIHFYLPIQEHSGLMKFQKHCENSNALPWMKRELLYLRFKWWCEQFDFRGLFKRKNSLISAGTLVLIINWIILKRTQYIIYKIYKQNVLFNTIFFLQTIFQTVLFSVCKIGQQIKLCGYRRPPILRKVGDFS